MGLVDRIIQTLVLIDERLIIEALVLDVGEWVIGLGLVVGLGLIVVGVVVDGLAVVGLGVIDDHWLGLIWREVIGKTGVVGVFVCALIQVLVPLHFLIL